MMLAVVLMLGLINLTLICSVAPAIERIARALEKRP